MEFLLNNLTKLIMEFLLNDLTKPPVARKLVVRHSSFVRLTASFQATGGYRF